MSPNVLPESEEDSVELHTGEIIAGKYRIEKLVGRGGMGVVVSAQHVALGQTVAIKILLVEGLDDARRRDACTRFLREGQSAARLTSDHVVRIYDVGTLDSGAPFMVMELLRGEDLGTLLERQGPAPVEVAVEYVVQASDAVAEAHATGIVHRDLKPSNLFLSRRSDGRPLVKVLDFGISKAMIPGADAFEGSLTATRSVVGSPYYMSPEQVRDAKRVDARTDIWSLGMILYELMTGAPAFNADTLPGICAAIAADAPAPVRERRPDVPPEVEAIVMRCLEKDPAKRFQSVSDLVKALAPFVPQSPASSALYASRAGVVDSLDAPIFSPDAPTIGLAPSSGPRPLANGGFANAATDPPEAMPHTMASEQGAAPGTPVPENLVGSPRKDDPAVATLVSSSGNKALSGSPSSGFGVRRVGFVVLTIAALGAAALVGVALRPSPSPPSVSSSLRAGTPPRPASFTLSIESTPSGANVFDGDRIVGKTPFTTVLDNAAVDSVPRNLMLRLDGFEPYEVSQGPSDTSVRVSAALAPVREAAHGAAQPAPSASSAAVSKPRMATSKSVLHRPAPAPASTAAPADIRLER